MVKNQSVFTYSVVFWCVAKWLSDMHKQTMMDDNGKPEQTGVMGYVAPPNEIHKGCCFPLRNFAPLNKILIYITCNSIPLSKWLNNQSVCTVTYTL